eukprot:12706_1
MLSAVFKGNSMIIGTTGVSMLLGGLAGGFMIYSYQNEPTKIEYWNKLWSEYRSKYPSVTPPWEQQHNSLAILSANNNEYLKLFAPRLPRLSNPSQVKSLRILVPLCGASDDLETINNFMTDKIRSEVKTDDEAKQYRLKIVGVDASDDALQMFLDKVDMKEKDVDPKEIDYNAEYNFANNHCLYSIDEDVFSKINLYKEHAYNLINADIFDASMQRLILRADAVYDNQALSVINPKRREQYLYLMQNVVHKNAKILLVTERYNIEERAEEQRDEAPYSINSKDEIFSLYKKLVNMEPKNVKLLKSIPWIETGAYGKQKLKSHGFATDYTGAYTDVWLIQCQH